ncbi:hypothetical protein EVAR_53501_1 [Eumeta japonica]|uniref:Uncharacterized protein n=1 Tax=Eumeta variegata TaxID=151549 RepID=A0A4C1Y8G9_EUMVA|nr:hypothetical protein EVAR_53501_1 [Eumeta japonica]
MNTPDVQSSGHAGVAGLCLSSRGTGVSCESRRVQVCPCEHFRVFSQRPNQTTASTLRAFRLHTGRPLQQNLLIVSSRGAPGRRHPHAEVVRGVTRLARAPGRVLNSRVIGQFVRERDSNRGTFRLKSDNGDRLTTARLTWNSAQLLYSERRRSLRTDLKQILSEKNCLHFTSKRAEPYAKTSNWIKESSAFITGGGRKLESLITSPARLRVRLPEVAVHTLV